MVVPSGTIFTESRDSCACDPDNLLQFLVSRAFMTTTSTTAAPFSPHLSNRLDENWRWRRSDHRLGEVLRIGGTGRKAFTI